MSVEIHPGDWVVDVPPLKNLCYEVRSIEPGYIKLRAFHITSKQRFNCTSRTPDRFRVIRTKEGARVAP